MRRSYWLWALLLLCACGSPSLTTTTSVPPARTSVATVPAAASAPAAPSVAVLATPRTTATANRTAAATARSTVPPRGTPGTGLIVQGTGNATSRPLSLPTGVGFIRLAHQGRGPFSADLIGTNGRPAQLRVAEGTGARTVPGLFSVMLTGSYTFDVRADGPWTIAVSTPEAAEVAQARPIPQTFSGQGSGITPFFTAEGRGIRVAVGHGGAGAIQVTLAGGASRTRVFGGTGPIAPEFANTPIPGGCTCVFLVDTDGPWTIEVQP